MFTWKNKKILRNSGLFKTSKRFQGEQLKLNIHDTFKELRSF
jgi:hypothetical protein